ncbi:RDD family protein [Parendozoicomonas haliclonae]
MPKQKIKPESSPAYLPAPLWRRLAAMVYDSMLLIALIFVVTAIYHGVVNNWLLGVEDAPVGFNPFLSTIYVFICFFFLAHFWGKNGQTLGMQAWRLRVQKSDGSNISLMQSLLRFVVGILSLAPAGLGLFWMLVDKDKKTWYDRYAETEVVYIPK